MIFHALLVQKKENRPTSGDKNDGLKTGLE